MNSLRETTTGEGIFKEAEEGAGVGTQLGENSGSLASFPGTACTHLKTWHAAVRL